MNNYVQHKEKVTNYNKLIKNKNIKKFGKQLITNLKILKNLDYKAHNYS